MDEPILVTGGTGTLGRVLVERLRARGAMPRVLSRKQGEGRVVGDLATGDGLDVALAGARTILHLASSPEGDAAAAASLIDAARRAGTEPHLVFISIVGIDRIPLPYYRAKLEVERLVEASGLPWTVLRATQFPDLLVSLFGVLARSPVLPVAKGVAFQPVDVHDVAQRLVELASGPPRGRVADMGGPEVLPMDDLARRWLAATGRRRPVLPLPIPGAIGKALRAGANLTPEHAAGSITFERYLAAGARA
jgi:uncharacterized protein YbjT (DUF2867 family)